MGDTTVVLFIGGIIPAPQGQDGFNDTCDDENDKYDKYESCENLHKYLHRRCIRNGDAVLIP